jgi:hypothetical protein
VITALWGVLVVVCVLVAVATLNLVNRLIPTTLREDHNDVAGFIYAVVGVVYAVLLAFVVIAVWQNYEAARDTTVREADELAEIFFLAQRFPEPERTRIQELARSYARVVVDEEWPLIAEGRASPRAWETLDELRDAVQGYEPRTEAGQALYGEELDRVNGLGDARRDRLIDARMGIRPSCGPCWCWGRDHWRLHLPLRAEEQPGAHADGRRPYDGPRDGALHDRRPGVPLLGLRASPAVRLRARPRQVRHERPEHPPVGGRPGGALQRPDHPAVDEDRLSRDVAVRRGG